MDTYFIWLLIAAAAVTLVYYRFILSGSAEKKTSPLQLSGNTAVTPEQLIARPLTPITSKGQVSLTYEPEEDDELELVDTGESLLLKAAENVVEQIQDTLHHIASSPPDLTEITSKVRAILTQYKIFLNTEYFDAINTFVCVTVERECQVQMTTAQVEPLWN